MRRREPAARSASLDLAFTVGAGGLALAAAVLGITLGLASPSWMLAAGMIAVGVVLALVVAARGRLDATTTSTLI